MKSPIVKFIKMLPATIISLVFLSGCSTIENNKRLRAELKKEHQRLSKVHQQINKKYQEQRLLAKKPKKKQKTIPEWTQKKINFNSGDKGVTLKQAMQQLLNGTNAIVSYDRNISKDKIIKLKYEGNINQVLKKIARLADYHFEYDGDDLIWNAVVTKSININFIPGKTNYTIGSTKPGDNANQRNLAFDQQRQTKQYSNLSGNFDILKDTETAVRTMLSKDGQLTMVNSLTKMLVTDHPSNVRKIEKFVAGINKDLTKQVLLKVVIAEVRTNEANNIGIDWDLVSDHIRGLSSATLTGSLGGIVTNTTSSSFTANFRGGSKAILQALEQVADTSIVTQPMMMTTNGQVVELTVVKETAYLQGQQSTITQVGNVVTQVSPSRVDEGVKIFILPKIYDGKIYMQITTSLSTVQGINDIKSDGQVIMQTPIVDTEHFNSRAIVANDSTLILSGFQNELIKTGGGKLFGISELGGEGSERFTHELVMLVTPLIVDVDDTLVENDLYISN